MEKIKIRNNLRRPVTFRIPGKNIRLAPGGSAEIPEPCLETPELKKLCLQRSISVLREKKELAKTVAKAKSGKEKREDKVVKAEEGVIQKPSSKGSARAGEEKVN